MLVPGWRLVIGMRSSRRLDGWIFSSGAIAIAEKRAGRRRELRSKVRLAVVTLHHAHGPCLEIDWSSFGGLEERIIVL